MESLKAPFPWFGGKSRVAHVVWDRFGEVKNYVEPFYGSGAVLLGRPNAIGTETVNDKDGFISNFWRSIQNDPDATALYADWPVNENDLHARHSWLMANSGDLPQKLEGHPDYFDPKIAGWWVYGICSWIGSGWCSGKGPWRSVDGKLVKVVGDAGRGVNRQLPHLGDAGRGVNRQLPHLGNAGMGVNRQLPHLGNAGMGVRDMFVALSARLRGVRVACGDWSRVTGGSVTFKHGMTGVFLDPPYTESAGHFGGAYTHGGDVGHDVARWCRDNGDNPKLRIALCGYDGEHDLPGWDCFAWKTKGGFGSQAKAGTGRSNASRERIWFSPNCINPKQGEETLFK